MNKFDLNTQLDISYKDTINVIAKAKDRLFEITKWIITLESGVIGLYFSIKIESKIFILLPIFIGIMGLILSYSIAYELNVHRNTLAKIRKEVGGFIYEMNKEQVELVLDKKDTSHKFYYIWYKTSNFLIIILSTILTTIIILLK